MAAITVTDLTSGTVDGTGIFDELMNVTQAHIQEEYAKNRIKGSEYANVYLGALQAVMDRSLQFLLQQQRTDLEAQLMAEQIESEKLNQDLVKQQTLNAVTENDVMLKQICKLEAEFDLLMEQKLKTVSETALLNQKKVTEQAQTSGTGVDADSVIGKQKTLYKNQADGFKRDAEQKAAKLMVDTWNVRRTTDEGTIAGQSADGSGVDNRLGDADIARVIDKLLGGVNA